MHFESLQHIKWLPVLLGGLGHFALGAIWYSKILFAQKWLVYTKIDVTDPNAGKGMAGIFGASILMALLSSFAIAVLAYKMQTNGFFNGAHLGLLVGVCFGVTAISNSYLFEKRPPGLHLINGGYTVIGSMIAGIIVCSM
jgi:Protein of unknown function (DUF1761)